MEFVWFLLVGLIAGWLAGQFMKGGGFGMIGDIVVGVLGALVGGFIFRSLGVSTGGGLIGRVTKVTDTEAEVELGQGVKVRAVKSTLSQVVDPTAAPAAND